MKSRRAASEGCAASAAATRSGVTPFAPSREARIHAAVLLRVVGRRLPGEPRGHRGLHAAAQAAHLARQVDEVAQVAAREDNLRERLAEEGGVLEGEVDQAKKRERADEALVAPADDGVRERAGLRALQEADRVRRHLLRGGVEGVAHRARHGELDQTVRVAHRPRGRAFGIDRVGGSRCDGGGNRVFEFFHWSQVRRRLRRRWKPAARAFEAGCAGVVGVEESSGKLRGMEVCRRGVDHVEAGESTSEGRKSPLRSANGTTRSLWRETFATSSHL